MLNTYCASDKKQSVIIIDILLSSHSTPADSAPAVYAPALPTRHQYESLIESEGSTEPTHS